jgi:very-short-patch-repair endonuclease
MLKRIRRTLFEVEQQAKVFRKEPTLAEEALWQVLRNGQVLGLKFRRQHAVGRFILDFYCAKHRLVIEVDGSVHKEQQERDAERTMILEGHGYRVLRFMNEKVLTDMGWVLARIAQTASEIETVSIEE